VTSETDIGAYSSLEDPTNCAVITTTECVTESVPYNQINSSSTQYGISSDPAVEAHDSITDQTALQTKSHDVTSDTHDVTSDTHDVIGDEQIVRSDGHIVTESDHDDISAADAITTDERDVKTEEQYATENKHHDMVTEHDVIRNNDDVVAENQLAAYNEHDVPEENRPTIDTTTKFNEEGDEQVHTTYDHEAAHESHDVERNSEFQDLQEENVEAVEKVHADITYDANSSDLTFDDHQSKQPIDAFNIIPNSDTGVIGENFEVSTDQNDNTHELLTDKTARKV